MTDRNALKLKLQIYCGEEIAMGPGKADLLEAIARHGSISAAAKAMDMSYRRAWLLVDTMNRCWQGPLIEAVAGGSRDRGARVTALGDKVLALYRQMEAKATSGADAMFGQNLAGLLSRLPQSSGD
jgi:molybdate transport system regulatory protein